MSDKEMNLASVYRLSSTDNDCCLYLGEFSTWQGLQLFDPSLTFQATSMTDSMLPADQALSRIADFKIVRQATAFFFEEGNHLDMIDFECQIDGGVKLSTHDDGECHIQLTDLDLAQQLLQKTVPSACIEVLWLELVANQGSYVTLAASGFTTTFATFDDYIRDSRNS